MRTRIIQGLSVLLLVITVVWFVVEPGFEPLLTAIAGLVGLLSGEFLKARPAEAPPTRGPDRMVPTRQPDGMTAGSSILVLPFDNISPDPADTYFSDGLTEEIITSLSRLRSLRVISRNSAMALKGSQKDTRTIAAELGVQFVLEGSVRKSGSDLRITAQLIAAGSDEHLWAEKYQGVLGDVFGIQEEVSRSIVDALTLELSPEEDASLARRPFEDPTAFDCYLRARQEYWKMSPRGMEEARRHVRNGLQIVGENELLLATLGYVTLQSINFGFASGPEHLPEAEHLASKIFAINPDSAHGHTLLGWIGSIRGQPGEAVKHLHEALRLDPSLIEAVSWMAITCLTAGRPEAAGPHVQELMRIDPLTPVHHSLLAYWLVLNGETGKALDSYRRMYTMDPGNPFYQVLFARMLVLLGDEEKALEPLEGITRARSDQPLVRHGAILYHLLEGNAAAAAAGITTDLEAASRNDAYLSWWMADWLACLGREEKAVEFLRRAADLGFINWPVLSELDTFLEPIREGRPFRLFLDDVRVEWEAFNPRLAEH